MAITDLFEHQQKKTEHDATTTMHHAVMQLIKDQKEFRLCVSGVGLRKYKDGVGLTVST